VGYTSGRVPAGFFLAGLDSVCTGAPDPIRAFDGCRETDMALAPVHEPDYFPKCPAVPVEAIEPNARDV
jgi:hypothetical protein